MAGLLNRSSLSLLSSGRILTEINWIRSASSAYKVDLSGFLNPLGDDAPLNQDLGIPDKIPNKNPRALEILNISRRQEGWEFQSPKRNFYHKLVLEQSDRTLSAYVEHASGKRVVWASSQEYSLMKRLYSLQDISAVTAVAKVLARRCLKAGIDSVTVLEAPAAIEASERLRTFHDVMTWNGVTLKERPVVKPPERFGVDYDVVNPNRYDVSVDATVTWPPSSEEYDPDKDLLWENEGIERKHQFPQKTHEELRPLIDPEPINYKALLEGQTKSKLDQKQSPKLIDMTDAKLIEF